MDFPLKIAAFPLKIADFFIENYRREKIVDFLMKIVDSFTAENGYGKNKIDAIRQRLTHSSFFTAVCPARGDARVTGETVLRHPSADERPASPVREAIAIHPEDPTHIETAHSQALHTSVDQTESTHRTEMLDATD